MRRWLISENSLLLGKLLEPMADKAIISETVDLTHVALSKEEKHVP
jgi:hypothetical protein